ncbi:MAG: SPOR domain-containing protein [Candidatus Accumulibacter sp.]|jgi:hypothetical protein|nr:SPOR domain-containing protein [Accumulibacter sp.]
MRVFVFLLVFANLLFFAWARGYLSSGEPDALRAGDQLRADQICVVSNEQPPEKKEQRDKNTALPTVSPPPVKPSAPAVETPASADEPPPRADVCIALSDVAPTEADFIERLFAEKLPAFRLSRVTAPGNVSHWVHISALKTRRDAEAKVAELRKLGVTEYFIMQEEGADSFAVSLGLFSTRAAAESALAALKGKGVRSAQLIERPRRPGLSQIEILGPEAQVGEMRQSLDRILPQAKPGACAQNAAAP